MGVTWGPLTWRYLPADEAEALWDELIDWVEWLRGRYGLGHSQLPACWPNHPVAVEELTALMAAYTNAYRAMIVKEVLIRYHDLLIGWHRGELWPCIDRLAERASFGDCRPKECLWHPPGQQPLTVAEDAIDNDVQGRGIGEEQTVVRETTMTHLIALGDALPEDDTTVFVNGASWDFDPNSRAFHRRGD